MARPSRFLPEAAGHEVGERDEGRLLVLAVRGHGEHASPGRGEKEYPQDRLPVHRPRVAPESDARAVPVRRLHEARGGARMEAEAVRHLHVATDHAPFFSRTSLAT